MDLVMANLWFPPFPCDICGILFTSFHRDPFDPATYVVPSSRGPPALATFWPADLCCAPSGGCAFKKTKASSEAALEKEMTELKCCLLLEDWQSQTLLRTLLISHSLPVLPQIMGRRFVGCIGRPRMPRKCIYQPVSIGIRFTSIRLISDKRI